MAEFPKPPTPKNSEFLTNQLKNTEVPQSLSPANCRQACELWKLADSFPEDLKTNSPEAISPVKLKICRNTLPAIPVDTDPGLTNIQAQLQSLEEKSDYVFFDERGGILKRPIKMRPRDNPSQESPSDQTFDSKELISRLLRVYNLLKRESARLALPKMQSEQPDQTKIAAAYSFTLEYVLDIFCMLIYYTESEAQAWEALEALGFRDYDTKPEPLGIIADLPATWISSRCHSGFAINLLTTQTTENGQTGFVINGDLTNSNQSDLEPNPQNLVHLAKLMEYWVDQARSAELPPR